MTKHNVLAALGVLAFWLGICGFVAVCAWAPPIAWIIMWIAAAVGFVGIVSFGLFQLIKEHLVK